MNYDDAQAAIHTIEGTITEWQQTRAAKLAEIAELERAGPGLVLTGKLTSDGYARKLAEMRDQLPMIDTLLGTLHTQLAEAKRHAQVARIATMREQAQALRAEGEGVLAQREELLKQLEALEGPLYMASPRSHDLLHQADMLERGALALELRLDQAPPETTRRYGEPQRATIRPNMVPVR